MRNIKKIAFLWLISSMAIANTIQIENKTDSNMRVRIDYVTPDSCSPDNLVLEPGVKKVINSGLCCIKSKVHFEALSDVLQGQIFSYEPPRTGAWLSCKGWNAEAKQVGSNFVVETK